MRLAWHFLKCGNVRKIHQPSAKSAPVTQVWEMLHNYNYTLRNHCGDQVLKAQLSPVVDLKKKKKKFLNKCLPNVFDHLTRFPSKYLLLARNTNVPLRQP